MDSSPPATIFGRGHVLVADGFEEETTIACVRALRDAGIAASLVGLMGGPVTGSRGIIVQPDLSMDQVLPDDILTLVVLPGGRRSTTVVLTDPPVHCLVEAATAGGGEVALLNPIVEGAEQLLRVPLVRQGTLTIQQFMAGLLNANDS